MKMGNHLIRVTKWTASLFGALATVAVVVWFTSAPVEAQSLPTAPTTPPESSSTRDEPVIAPADTASSGSGTVESAPAPGAPISLSPGQIEQARSMIGNGAASPEAIQRLCAGVAAKHLTAEQIDSTAASLGLSGEQIAELKNCVASASTAHAGGGSVRDLSKLKSDSGSSGRPCGERERPGTVVDRELLSFARRPIAAGAQSDPRKSAPIRLLLVQRPGLNFRTAR